jgi:hypothetical protein
MKHINPVTYNLIIEGLPKTHIFINIGPMAIGLTGKKHF